VAMLQNKMDYKLSRSKQKQGKSAVKLAGQIRKMNLRKEKSVGKLNLNNYRMEQRKKKSAMHIKASRNVEARKWGLQRSNWA